MNRWWWAGALAICWGFYWVQHLLFLEWPFSLPHEATLQVHLRGFAITNLVMAGLAILYLPAMWGFKTDRSTSRFRKVIVGLVVLVFAGIQMATWRQYFRSADVMIEDVGQTSMAADWALGEGKNPYAIAVDPPGGTGRFVGYKYLPVTLGVYALPAMLTHHAGQGVVTANLVLSVLTAMVLVWVVGKEVSLDAGLLCAALYFMSEIVSTELVVHGNNDIIPMLLIMLALGNGERRLFCGVLLGLSISSKSLPGLLWIPILLVPKGNKRYWWGILMGLVPCLPFLVWGPGEMFDNVVTYVVTKPWHFSAPLYGMPGWVRTGAEVVVAGVWIGAGLFALRHELDVIRRCAIAGVMTLMFELASPTVHQNYFVWWYVPLCVVTAAFVFNPGVYGWIGRRGTTE